MDFIIRPYRPGEEEYVADAHRRVYSEEYRWGEPFISYAMHIPLAFAQKAPSPREGFWIAEADGRPVGSIMLCETDEPELGQLRLFLVEKPYRRGGIGKALTATLLNKARAAGYRQLVLETAHPLTDAITHYEHLGFRKVEESPNTDWSLDGDTVYEIKMRMDLSEE